MRNPGPTLALLALSLTSSCALAQASMSILMGTPDPPVVGLPYSADQSVKIVQHLANGMVLTHQMTGRVYRSADGAERLEGIFLSIDPTQPDPVTVVYLIDRVRHTATILNPKAKSAIVTPFPADATLTFTFLPLPNPLGTSQPVKLDNPTTTDLGKRTQDMLDLVGKRVTATIPIGKIGNAQPIPVTTDTWVAPQLKLLVKQVEDNPVTGERTFELTNIRSQEPAPSLFAVPDDYTLSNRPLPSMPRPAQPAPAAPPNPTAVPSH